MGRTAQKRMIRKHCWHTQYPFTWPLMDRSIGNQSSFFTFSLFWLNFKGSEFDPFHRLDALVDKHKIKTTCLIDFIGRTAETKDMKTAFSSPILYIAMDSLKFKSTWQPTSFPYLQLQLFHSFVKLFYHTLQPLAKNFHFQQRVRALVQTFQSHVYISQTPRNTNEQLFHSFSELNPTNSFETFQSYFLKYLYHQVTAFRTLPANRPSFNRFWILLTVIFKTSWWKTVDCSCFISPSELALDNFHLFSNFWFTLYPDDYFWDTLQVLHPCRLTLRFVSISTLDMNKSLSKW